MGPGWIPGETYIDCRWETLRRPLGLGLEAAFLPDDEDAIHAMIIEEDRVLSVGRAHLIPAGEDGSMADHEGEDSAICPAFLPLSCEAGVDFDSQLRPAFHIRQMGTREDCLRRGMGSRILFALEQAVVENWGCRSGWLQARTEAIPFYSSQGWEAFGETYHIVGVGPHRSMSKMMR